MDENPTVVKEELTLPETSHVITESVTSEEGTTTVPGAKTDSALLLKSLQEEREKRRLLEEENLQLKSSTLSEDVFSDEGKLLQRKIDELKSQMDVVKKDSAKKDLLISYPILTDKIAEFDEFRELPENKGMNMRTAAKAFLVENGLLEVQRKGLERPTGGDKTPTPSGVMTSEEVATLRTTNYKKYVDMLTKGQIKIA